ncbi:MAG: FISUMP domain-containing protein, partial [Candidatus Saccharimonadaceae bacterium]|nr:FISUMP domain-containing protein [Candidatus Saccharimonadaceae bacterium]
WCTDYDSTPCYNQSKLNTNNTALTTTSPAFSQNYTNGTHASDFNTNLYSYGNYYNWYSATAGRGTRETSGNQVVAGDICPAGWQLPYGGSGDANNGKGNTSGGFYYLNNLLGNSSNAWRSFPNNFIYSGYWYNSSPSSRGNTGYYWSSTAESYTSSAYYLNLANSYTGFYSSSKYTGSSVRCVAPIQTTITFDGNGNDGGEMAKQRIAANATAPLNQNTFTKNDYVFASWNTERDGSGTSYTDGQDFTVGEGINKVTLYAQWREPAVISDLTYMQNFAVLSEIDKTSVLYSMAEGQQYQLKDSRDQKDYYISKLADGNIWMTQNLDLDIEAGRTYTSADTDLANSSIGTTWTPTSSEATYPTGTTTWNWSDTTPESYNPGNLYWNGNVTTSGGSLSNRTTTDSSATSGGTHYHVGNYYNWTAAVAMSNSSSYTTYHQDVNQSICPAGWRLPTYSGDKSYQNLVNAQGLSVGTSGNIQNSPVYFVYGGYWDGSFINVGSGGYYRSSVVYNSGASLSLYFRVDSGLYPQSNTNRNPGFLLRCVAR